MAGLATLIAGGIILQSQAGAYMKAGVRGGEAVAGGIAAYLLIVAVLLVAATLYRMGCALALVRDVAIGAGLAGLVFGLLPYVVAGRSPLTVVLGVVMMAAWEVWMAVWVAVVALYLPQWWDPKA